jgi:ABC-type sugar transport system ATPase subunit
MIEVQGLTVRVDRATLLDAITTSFPRQKISVVLGPSGAGKTTLLRAIAGLQQVTSGSIRFDGRDVTELPPSSRRVAMVFQEAVLLPHWSIERNIALPLWARGVSPSEVRTIVVDVATKLGIVELLARKPEQISGGQAQRAAVARALAGQDPTILLDESFSALDDRLRREVSRDCISAIRSSGGTAVLVTHDQDLALGIADHLVVLSGGRVRQQGTPQEVFDVPANIDAARALGRPPMNLLRATENLPRELFGDGDLLGFRPADAIALHVPGNGPRIHATFIEAAYRGTRSDAVFRTSCDQHCTVEVDAVPTQREVFLSLRKFHRFLSSSGERRP